MTARPALRGLLALMAFAFTLAFVAQPSRVLAASALPVPPPGGLTQGIAGTDDPAALLAAQAFDVHSIWLLEPEQQRWRVFLAGAPAMVNTLTAEVLSPDAVVMIRRSGTLVLGSTAAPGGTGSVAATGTGNAFSQPPPGGLVYGVAGTNDPTRLVEQQPFEAASVFMLDIPTQRWLSYVPGAPPMLNSLHTGTLSVDAVVMVRRALPSPAPALSAVSADEAEMVALVNEARAANGLSALRVDLGLTSVARAHSADMRDRDYFAHDNPDGDSPFDRMHDAGITYRSAGENLALAGTVARAHDLLLDSDGHRRNILNADFGRVGIGIVESSEGLMITQIFAD